jgi:RimJ/RimL family protein N-acetyltransferase
VTQLETKRLSLRPVDLHDTGMVAVWMNDWGMVSMLGRTPWPYGLADALAFTRYAETAWQNGNEYAFALVPYAQPDLLIGCIGLLRQSEEEWELGYWLARAFWGDGLMVEAAQAIVGHAFNTLGALRLTSGHFKDNARSAGVLKKLGFTRTGERLRPCLARRADVLGIDYELYAPLTGA